MPQKANPLARSSARPEFVIVPQAMTGREAAIYVGLNYYDLHRKTCAGEIKAVLWGKNGKNLRWRKSDLDEWLASRPLANGPVRARPGTRRVTEIRHEPEPAA